MSLNKFIINIYSITNLIILSLYDKCHYFYTSLIKIQTVWFIKSENCYRQCSISVWNERGCGTWIFPGGCARAPESLLGRRVTAWATSSVCAVTVGAYLSFYVTDNAVSAGAHLSFYVTGQYSLQSFCKKEFNDHVRNQISHAVYILLFWVVGAGGGGATRLTTGLLS